MPIGDVYVPSWQQGAPASFDFAVASPVRQDAVLQASLRPGAAATAYEQFKRTYLNTALDCQRQGISFIPLVAEPSGGWGPSAQCVFKAIARAISTLSGRSSGVELREHRQAFCVLLRQANARAIFSRTPDFRSLELDPLVSARQVLDAMQ